MGDFQFIDDTAIDGNPFVDLAHSKDEAMSRLASMAITLEQA